MRLIYYLKKIRAAARRPRKVRTITIMSLAIGCIVFLCAYLAQWEMANRAEVRVFGLEQELFKTSVACRSSQEALKIIDSKIDAHIRQDSAVNGGRLDAIEAKLDALGAKEGK